MSEAELVKSFNIALKKNGVAFRLKQSRFASQIIDILVDSKFGYFAIEHKSISKKTDIYFSSNFAIHKDGTKQIETINKYINRSNRLGFLFIELRKGRGIPLELYAIPWNTVWEIYSSGEKGIKDIPKVGQKIKRKNGEWLLKSFIKRFSLNQS